MADGGPQRQVLGPALRRFWAVSAVAATLAGLVAAGFVQLDSSVSWSAQASFVVPLAPTTVLGSDPQPVSALPDNLQDASRYASTYAVFLVEDIELLSELGEATGLSARQVADRTAAATVPGTPVLRVNFTADTSEQVQAYFDRLGEVVSNSPSVTPNLPAGSLRLLRAAELQEQEGLAPVAPVVGVLVGLLVGLGVAVLLEWSDPRLRSAADVRELADWPVLKLPNDGLEHASTVSRRVLSAAPVVRQVCVVGLSGTSGKRVAHVAGVLESAAARTPDHLAASRGTGRTSLRGGDVQWLAGGALGQDGFAEGLAQQSDVVVLVAPLRARLPHLDLSVRTLQDLGVNPVLVVLVTGSGWREPTKDHIGTTFVDETSTDAAPADDLRLDPDEQSSRSR